MQVLKINGNPAALPNGISQDQNISELINLLQKEPHQSETRILTGVRIDGREMDPFQTDLLSHHKLSEVTEADLIFSHPRELAEEMLQTLKIFLPRIIELCKNPTSATHVKKIFDGIQMMVDSIEVIRSVLPGTETPELMTKEKELADLLQGALTAREEGRIVDHDQILRESLSVHLESWIQEVIPSIIHRHDC